VHSDPAEAYRTRLADRRAVHGRLTQADLQFSYLRLGVFGLAVLIAVAAWQQVLSTWLLRRPRLVAGINIGAGVTFVATGLSAAAIRHR